MTVKTIYPNKYVLRAHAVQPIAQFTPGATIVCECGALWITQTGDGRDIILEEGDRFVEKKRGMVVVEALKESIFSIN